MPTVRVLSPAIEWKWGNTLVVAALTLAGSALANGSLAAAFDPIQYWQQESLSKNPCGPIDDYVFRQDLEILSALRRSRTGRGTVLDVMEEMEKQELASKLARKCHEKHKLRLNAANKRLDELRNIDDLKSDIEQLKCRFNC